MASYSDVAAKNIPRRLDISSGYNQVSRTKTVRFRFEVLPDKKDFLEAVLQVLQHEHVKTIQTLPGGRVDLTVRHDDNVTDIVHCGIDLNGETWFPKPLGFRTTYAYVQYLPSEMPSVQVCEAMSRYGKVLSVKRQLYEGTMIETGTRIVSLEVTSPIPSYVFFAGYKAKIWHRGQVQTCAKCHSPDHFVKDCPITNFSMDNPQENTKEPTPETTANMTEQSPTKTTIEQEPLPQITQEAEDDQSDSSELSDFSDDEETNDDNETDAQQDNEEQQDAVLDQDIEVNRPVKRALAPSTPTKKPGQKPPKKKRKKKDKNKKGNHNSKAKSAGGK